MTGLARYIEARVNCRTPINGQNISSAAANNIVGAMAECAVAKAMGAYWCGEWLNHKAADAAGYQVRHTEYKSGKLLLQPCDSDDEIYVLVTGTPPTFRVVGAIRCGDGKKDCYWDSSLPRPCYVVPQASLGDLPVDRQTHRLPDPTHIATAQGV